MARFTFFVGSLRAVAPASADWVVFTDGQRTQVQAVEIAERAVHITTQAGKRWSVARDSVDVAATLAANETQPPPMTPNFETVSFPTAAPRASSFALSADDDDSVSIDERNTLNTLINGPPAPDAPSVMTRDDEGNATLRAVRLEEPLVIDGSLDERVYARVPAMSGFVQQEPRAGELATEPTEVWVFFDNANVYISARLWDSHPERMVANEMRRDNRSMVSQNETFSVILDTFYDRRNGFLFRTNPLGALWDGQVTDEKNVNSDWNTIWYVKSTRLAEGWTLEMSLPFKSLRYRTGASQIWGINFERQVKWKNERSHLVPIPAAFDRRGLLKLSFAATLVGIETPTRSMNLEVKPYVSGATSTDLTADEPFANRGDANFGFDAKYGVTKGLIFDFTYNTDFAQVEADESQVNLTRFSLFFPEKREFFLEGQGIFNFGGRDTRAFSFSGPSDAPVMFFSRRIGLEDGNEVPILAGGRLTGRAGPYSLGFLNISTEDVVAGGVPQTNYSVVRVKRDIFARSNIGFIGTYRNKNLDHTGSNGLFGVDGNFTFFENLTVDAYYARTDTAGLDQGDTSYRGAVKYDADLYGFEAEHMLVDPDFNPELGFMRRDDFRKTRVGARYSIRPASIAAVRKIDFDGRYDHYQTVTGSEVETEIFELDARIRFESGDFANVTYSNNREALFEDFEITDDIFIPVGTYRFDRVRAWMFFSGHRRLSGRVGVETGSFFGGTRTELTFRNRVEVTPQFSLEPNVAINWIDLPQGAFTTNLARLRATYTLSPRSFVGALLQYNSENGSFTTNIRFRWEYRPGSDVFFVYSDGRDTLSGSGVRSLENRSVIVKVTRLFRF